MLEIKFLGLRQERARLISSEKLSSDDFDAIAKRMSQPAKRARKAGLVAARLSGEQQVVETQWNGKETQNEAMPDDWVVTNLGRDASVLRDRDGNTNTYVIKADRFGELYAATDASHEFGDVYRSISEVDAIYLPAGFEIMAPWGEVQTAAAGYLLRNGPEIYGNNKETFLATYEMTDGT